MPKYVRIALLPLVVALPLVMSPAGAVSIGTGSTAGAAPVTTSQATSKQQIKQQRKLAKQCAKLKAGKMKKASKRAKYSRLCAQPAVGAPLPVGGGAAEVDDDQDGTTPAQAANGDGSTADGGPGEGTPGQDYLDELLDLPPLFTPPQGGGDGPLVPELDVVTPSDVPEPGSLALLGLGLVGMALARARRGR